MPESGDDIMVDLGLPLVFPAPADGDPVLAKGLLRFCAEFDAISLCSIQSNQHVFGSEQKQNNLKPYNRWIRKGPRLESCRQATGKKAK